MLFILSHFRRAAGTLFAMPIKDTIERLKRRKLVKHEADYAAKSSRQL
jgi:hypothetical protein